MRLKLFTFSARKILFSGLILTGLMSATESAYAVACASFSFSTSFIGPNIVSSGILDMPAAGGTISISVSGPANANVGAFFLASNPTQTGPGTMQINVSGGSGASSGTVDVQVINNPAGTNVSFTVTCSPNSSSSSSSSGSSSQTGTSNGYSIGQIQDNGADEWTGGVPDIEGQAAGWEDPVNAQLESAKAKLENLRTQREASIEERIKAENRIPDINQEIRDLTERIAQNFEEIPDIDTSLFGRLNRGLADIFGDSDVESLQDFYIRHIREDQARRAELQTELAELEEKIDTLKRQETNLFWQIDELKSLIYDLETDGGINGGLVYDGFFLARNSDQERKTNPFSKVLISNNKLKSYFYLNAFSPDENTDIGDFSAQFTAARWAGWIDGNYTWTRDNRSGNESTGHAIKVEGGVLYNYNQRVNLGSKFRFKHSNSSRNDNSSGSNANALGASIFAQIQMPQGLLFTPVASFERSNTDINFTSGTVTGNFNTDIYMVGATLSKKFTPDFATPENNAYVEPNLSLSLMHGVRHAYTLSDNSSIAGANFKQGTLRFGPTFGWRAAFLTDRFASVDATIGMNGSWNFIRPDDFTSSSGSVVSTPEFSASLSAGISATAYSGSTISLNLGYSGVGSEVQSASISGRLRIPLGEN